MIQKWYKIYKILIQNEYKINTKINIKIDMEMFWKNLLIPWVTFQNFETGMVVLKQIFSIWQYKQRSEATKIACNQQKIVKQAELKLINRT